MLCGKPFYVQHCVRIVIPPSFISHCSELSICFTFALLWHSYSASPPASCCFSIVSSIGLTHLSAFLIYIELNLKPSKHSIRIWDSSFLFLVYIIPHLFKNVNSLFQIF